MIKKILLTTLTTVIGLILLTLTILYLYQNHWAKKRASYYPYPYQWVETLRKAGEDSILEDRTNILVIGGGQAFYLKEEIHLLEKEINSSLSKKIALTFLAHPGNGLHRTLQQIKELNYWPDVIVYLGGSNEFDEKRVILNEIKTIEENQKLFRKNSWYRTILPYVPLLSKILYKDYKLFPLWREPQNNNNSEQNQNRDDKITLRLHALLLDTFQQEYLELISLIRENKTHFISILPAIDWQRPIGRVCSFANNEDLADAQAIIFRLMENGEYKSAYREVQLLLEGPGQQNALSHFLKAELELIISNSLIEALPSYQMANVLDCAPQGTYFPFYQKLKEMNIEHDIETIDFNETVTSQLGRGKLFTKKDHPHPLFYQELALQLVRKIKENLGL